VAELHSSRQQLPSGVAGPEDQTAVDGRLDLVGSRRAAGGMQVRLENRSQGGLIWVLVSS